MAEKEQLAPSATPAGAPSPSGHTFAGLPPSPSACGWFLRFLRTGLAPCPTDPSRSPRQHGFPSAHSRRPSVSCLLSVYTAHPPALGAQPPCVVQGAQGAPPGAPCRLPAGPAGGGGRAPTQPLPHLQRSGACESRGGPQLLVGTVIPQPCPARVCGARGGCQVEHGPPPCP